MTLLSFASTAAVMLLLAGFAVMAEANRAGPVQTATSVVVPKGASVTSIARHLEAEGIVRSGIAFRIAVEIYARDRTLKAGEYEIASGASMASVIDDLAAGRVALHPVTIAEGVTSAMVVEALAAAEHLTGDIPPVPAEGAVLPETYNSPRGADRTMLLNQMIEARQEALAALWETRAKDGPLRSPEEAVILASIVEKETGLASERPLVASVFVNRLKKGMRLESDPTIIYGVSQGRPLGRGITRSELDRPTPYNTYKIPRLPPTPIANPGREALAAVLNPPQTDYLYFVAVDPFNPQAGHQFSKTYAEHKAAVARLRAAERAANR